MGWFSKGQSYDKSYGPPTIWKMDHSKPDIFSGFQMVLNKMSGFVKISDPILNPEHL